MKKGVYLLFVFLIFSAGYVFGEQVKEKDGITKIYYDSGLLKAEWNPVRGIYKEYYENGIVKWECRIAGGKLDGILKFYSKYGILRSECEYRKGAKDGYCKEYYRNKTLKRVVLFKPGIQGKIMQPADNDIRTMFELVFGFASEIIVGFAFAKFDQQMFHKNSSIYSGWIGSLLGASIGTSLAVYTIGNIGNETGSFKQTLAGSTIGLFIPFIGPPLFATIRFNESRAYDKETLQESGYDHRNGFNTNMRKDNFCLNNNSLHKHNIVLNFDLVKINF